MSTSRIMAAIAGPTDWQGSFRVLHDLDESLHCEICANLFEAPVAFKSCGHSFCSRCIRTHINKVRVNAKPNCPKCLQEKAWDSELVALPSLEAAATAWRASREALLKLSADHNRTQERIRPSSTRLGKRKSPATPPDSNSTDGSSPGADGGDRLQEDRGIGSSSSRRRSMRQKKSHPSKGSARRSFYAEIPEGADEDSDGFEMLESNDKTPPPKLADATGDVNGDSLFMCPSCNYIFTQSALMRHTDEKMMMCSPDDPEPTLAERGLNPTAPVAGGNSRGSGKLDSFFKKPNQSHTLTPMGAALDAEGSSSDSRGLPFPPSSQRHVMPSSSRSDRDCERGQREVQITVVQAPQPKRLHRPDFGKKKDKDLKLLCREYGIAETGGKPRMIERLREWINLYNGNLDASEANRKDARDLRKELKEWERRLDSLKEMDAAGRSEKIHHSSWVQTHREEFWRLTRLAVVSATKARLGAERERRREAVPESEQDDDRQHVIISRDGSLLPE